MSERKPTVLVVADGPAGGALGGALAAAGYRAVAATGAEAGLRRARQAQPALVVLAVAGNPDGWEASRRLKADPLTAPIPVLVVADRVDRTRAEESRCDAFRQQPLSAAQLLEAVAALLAGER